MKSIALITTTKGRLHHLRETLPLMLAQGADEVIVVDYDCPDGSGDWVERHHPGVQVVRVDAAPSFCAARARNMGAAVARSEWLVFIDGDIRTHAGWVDWMREFLEPGNFYRAASGQRGRDPELEGTSICRRADFDAVGGYDEVFDAWGGEDTDLYGRLERHGLRTSFYPISFVDAIRHGDEERSGWGGLGSKRERWVLLACYIEAKSEFAMRLAQSTDLAYEHRRRLMDRTREAVKQWFDQGATRPLSIRYVLDTGATKLRAPNPFSLEKELALTLRLQRRPDPRRAA